MPLLQEQIRYNNQHFIIYLAQDKEIQRSASLIPLYKRSDKLLSPTAPVKYIYNCFRDVSEEKSTNFILVYLAPEMNLDITTINSIPFPVL